MFWMHLWSQQEVMIQRCWLNHSKYTSASKVWVFLSWTLFTSRVTVKARTRKGLFIFTVWVLENRTRFFGVYVTLMRWIPKFATHNPKLWCQGWEKPNNKMPMNISEISSNNKQQPPGLKSETPECQKLQFPEWPLKTRSKVNRSWEYRVKQPSFAAEINVGDGLVLVSTANVSPYIDWKSGWNPPLSISTCHQLSAQLHLH